MSNNKRKATPSMYEDENIIHELVSYTRDQAANKEGALSKATLSKAVDRITEKKQEVVQEVIETKSDEDEEQTALIPKVSKEEFNPDERMKSEIFLLTSDSDSDDSDNESESGLSGYKEYWCCKCEKGLDDVEALVNFDNKELYCANCISSNTEQRDIDLKWARFANK